MLTLLHSADWQIGKPFGRFDPEEAVLLAQARIDAVATLARLGVQHQVDAILVAGDVFDAQTVSDKTIRRLFGAMAGFEGPWVMIPGNHDAALAESVWTRAARMNALPANLILCTRSEVVLLNDVQLALLPAPLTQRHTFKDLSSWFDDAATPTGYYRVGLAHGSVEGILDEDIDSPNPIAADRAEQAHLDYLALGDWHGQKEITPRCWYSGTPEPDRFRQNESGSALLIELDAPGAQPRVTPLPTARYRWRQHHQELRIDSDVIQLRQWLGELDDKDVVDLSLAGSIDLAHHQQLDEMLSQAQGRARSLFIDRQTLRVTPSEAELESLSGQGYVGDVIQELREQQHAGNHAEDRQAAQDALVLLADMLQLEASSAEEVSSS